MHCTYCSTPDDITFEWYHNPIMQCNTFTPQIKGILYATNVMWQHLDVALQSVLTTHYCIPQTVQL